MPNLVLRYGVVLVVLVALVGRVCVVVNVMCVCVGGPPLLDNGVGGQVDEDVVCGV